VKMANNADGTSSGTLVNLDGAAVEVPITIAQKGTAVTLGIKITSSTFSGALNGSELAGTWSQGPVQLPLTFKRQ
jgi:hypothetical protein